MNGLSTLNIELTSRCNKSCAMCGRRKMEREHPELCNWGDISYEMVEEIAKQIPNNVVVQLHNNGEPLLYPFLGRVLGLLRNNIRCLNTNAKMLMEKADEIIDNLETLTISVIQDDPEGEEQYDTVVRFLETKGSRLPRLVYRLLGNCDNILRWRRLSGTVARRILHIPDASRDYEKPVTIPEIGICLDLLTHMAIDRFGKVSQCVRFDPEGLGVLGHVSEGLENIWNGDLRQTIIKKHIRGERNEVPLCAKCDYWGVPTGC
jgi:MoaA/NifB/PqqE/SkfB family radical SAM enzyme